MTNVNEPFYSSKAIFYSFRSEWILYVKTITLLARHPQKKKRSR